MPTIAKDSGGTYTLVAPGTYAARCVQIIQLGTQEIEYNGERSMSFKIMLGFEIPELRIEKDGQSFPMMQSKEYTLSLHEKATLRHDLESWRGQAFTEEEAKGFDVEKLLNVPCLISIIHGTSNRTGKKYAKINSIVRLPKGMDAPKQESDAFVYDITMSIGGTYERLPEWIRKKIDNALEMNPPNAVAPATGEPYNLNDDDPLPF